MLMMYPNRWIDDEMLVTVSVTLSLLNLIGVVEGKYE